MNSDAARKRLLSYLIDNPGKHTAANLCKAVRLRSPHQVGRYSSQMYNIKREVPRGGHAAGTVLYWYEEAKV